MSEITLKLPEEQIEAVVDKVIAQKHLVPESSLQGRTIGIEEFRHKYCGGKSSTWVRLFIFDKFKPDWVKGIHPGSGGKTIIFAYPAAKWMARHWKDIDWEAKL